ncbi:hypothetical protein QYM36_014542 [Artemia franciscana]|uniref:Reverse transcriptase domain-containing protein n=1 Tax=Artemia franciscana TaxID=6661 RepID=A0AA88HJY1_ARTSF|nr:hypothetical protein QYM36_014542 [Artemia franciscana]
MPEARKKYRVLHINLLRRSERRRLEISMTAVDRNLNSIVLYSHHSRKADASLRFCLSFHGLNTISRFDTYPLPRIDELLKRVGSKKILGILDLVRGCWQIKLEKGGRGKMIFQTSSGLYQFLLMPFGLHGAHVTFQSRMDKVLEPCEAFARAYMNDIVIFSDSWEEHLVHDKRTLESIEDAGLRIHPRNIKLAQNEFRYLGKCTGIEEIAPLKIKVQAVQ